MRSQLPSCARRARRAPLRQVALLEQKQHRALAQWETRLKEAKAELIRATQQSTTALERVAQLLAAQAALEGALNKTQKVCARRGVPSPTRPIVSVEWRSQRCALIGGEPGRRAGRCSTPTRVPSSHASSQAGGAVSVPSSGQEDALERGRLVQMVKLQGKEVDALKVEINMLRRKGGHVYSPAPPAPA